MLTRLEVDGFKSFESLKIDLLPFTVILGSNAAGKSNLFDVIRLLSSLATKDVGEALKDMRGESLELFRQTAGGRSHRIDIAVEVLVDPVARDPWGSEVDLTHTRMRYEITLERREVRPGMERVQVAREAAFPIKKKDDKWAASLKPSRDFKSRYLKYARQKPLLTTESLNDGLSFSIHQDGKQGRVRPASAAEATVLYSITNAEFPHLFALREEMKSWRLLQLDPAFLRRPASVTSSDSLDPDGANLAAVLAHLKAETATDSRPMGVLVDIAAELNELIPDVKKVDASLNKASREYQVELVMRDGIPFSSRVISDGTLRVLSLLTLLHDPRHRGLVCFEEPENGVHPGRIKPLVQRLHDMVTAPESTTEEDQSHPLSQLLLNSHSPVVLSALIDRNKQSHNALILFADTSTITDPDAKEARRRTRLRPVRSFIQQALFTDKSLPQGFVSEYEVKRVLETVSVEG